MTLTLGLFPLPNAYLFLLNITKNRLKAETFQYTKLVI